MLRQCLLEIAWICIYDQHESGARTLPLCWFWLKKTAITKHTLGSVESCLEYQVGQIGFQGTELVFGSYILHVFQAQKSKWLTLGQSNFRPVFLLPF